MAFPNRGVVLILISFLTYLAGLAIAQGGHQCGTNGNYTQTSAYGKNLDVALSILNETNENGFFMSSSHHSKGDEPSSAYALALCRGDLNQDTCLKCVAHAINQLTKDCLKKKKATGWYDGCILSYSNSSLVDNVDDNMDVKYFERLVYYGSSHHNIISRAPFYQTMKKLFHQLRSQATRGGSHRKYASGNMNVPGSANTIYGIMQCSPFISQQQCGACLSSATAYLRVRFNGSADGRVYYRYSCFLRYQTSPFYNQSLSVVPPSTLSTPQLRGKKRISHKIIIGPAIAATAGSLRSPIETSIYILGAGEELFAVSDDDTGEMIYFTLSVMHVATNNFSHANKLGEGGFGPVYSGELSDGKKIAVKRLSQNSSQGLQEFKTEVKLIVKLQHKNLVRLLGCCIKGNERLLVYEYMANSSLDTYLFDSRKAKELYWAKRVKIVSGIAKGLRYLHEDSRLKIIHRDLKASNVLLDEEMNPKISDFGTARIFGLNQIEANTGRVVGTYGYMAPEYAMEGLFSIKSDVYSFGVLLLEIISGKRNHRLLHHEHDQNLLSYARMLLEEGNGEQLIDGNLKDDCRVNEALKWMDIALLCIQEDPRDRPTMSSVTFMLEGERTSLSKPKPSMSFPKIIISDHSSSMSKSDEVGYFSSDQTLQDEGY
ncbi:cysteine-rich receptor-like protein kinase 25 [Cynara cardunculus var. scolymus]|uniref:cysteine-rich receptor-like protein kinase 25 n=1 Tax=Cynara cardunculus var. scolymus TaxID=59895 RepID=UPI000D629BBB|nr:cysteine-rich receptor-like protein kinase 25 [Cynara cardunculus var. scolymus]